MKQTCYNTNKQEKQGKQGRLKQEKKRKGLRTYTSKHKAL